MIRLLLFIFCLVSCCTATFAQSTTMTMMFDGLQRSYTVHLPTGYTTGNHLPLVINMHGYTSDASQQEAYSKMSTTADANHFIVVYPDGVANAWNVGWQGAANNGANDVGFLGKVIDTIIAMYAVDANRVYACGMSNGGFMSHKLACDIGERIAAIASVAGTFSDSMVMTCNPARKMPVMQIHGTMDPTVPYNGFAGGIGVEATISKWLAFNQCSNVSDTLLVANTSTTDNTTVQRIDYRGCSDGTEVLFFKVIGGGHTWPSGLIDIPSYGNTNHDISASDEIWNFFKQYTLAGPVGISEVAATDGGLKVYPNPFSSQIKLTANTDIHHVVITNLLGETALDQQFSNIEVLLDLSRLSNGVYFVRAEGNGFVQVTKLIKD